MNIILICVSFKIAPVSTPYVPANSSTEFNWASAINPISSVYLFIFSSKFLNNIISCLYSLKHSSVKHKTKSMCSADLEKFKKDLYNIVISCLKVHNNTKREELVYSLNCSNVSTLYISSFIFLFINFNKFSLVLSPSKRYFLPLYIKNTEGITVISYSSEILWLTEASIFANFTVKFFSSAYFDVLTNSGKNKWQCWHQGE